MAAQDEVLKFVLDALEEMNFEVDEVTPDTLLGPSGVDMDSLAVAELALRIEDGYGLKFGEEETENLAIMTIGEFAAEVATRTSTVAQPEGATT